MKKNKVVTLRFVHWWHGLNPLNWIEKWKDEKKINDQFHRDAPKIRSHAVNVMTLGACNGDCGLETFHPSLKKEAPHNKNQDSAKSSADRQPRL